MATAARIRQASAALAAARPDLNSKAHRVLLGQALVESQFGDALTTPDGSSAHNWGMIYKEGDLGTVPQGDTSDGKPFTANAAWNSSDEVGAKQLVSLIEKSYSPALAKASDGDLYGYAKALWRGGPGSSRPPYYGGFPPGDRNSIAPKGTPLHSELDHFYRVLAYKRYIESGYRVVSSALGMPMDASTSEPAPPPSSGVSSSWFWGIVAVGTASLTGLYGWKSGWFDGARRRSR